MKMNLFELAERQLVKEKENGKRRKYTMLDILKYAVKIRRFLDKNGGNIRGILNKLTYDKQEIRRRRYIKNQEYKKKRKQ